MKYGKVTLGQVEAIINKLGGMEGVRRLLADELTVVEIKKQAFAIWKTIQLGTGLNTADAFRGALNSGGLLIGSWADDLLSRPAFKKSVATRKTECDLVVVSVADLGFKNGATREQIYNRAQELGLELCPAEVGPQLRLQYKDQPAGEWLLIGMEPITVSDGELSVFDVGRDDDGHLWLNGSFGLPGFFGSGDDRWVFVRPRK